MLQKRLYNKSIQKVIKILQTITRQKSQRTLFIKNTYLNSLYNGYDS